MTDISKHISAAHKLYDQLNFYLQNLPDDLSYPERRLPAQPSLAQAQFPCDVNTAGDCFVESFDENPNDVSKRSPLYFIPYEQHKKSGEKFKEMNQESYDISNFSLQPSKTLSTQHWSWFRDRVNINATYTGPKQIVKEVKDEDKQRDMNILLELEARAKMDYYIDPEYQVIPDEAYFRPPKQ